MLAKTLRQLERAVDAVTERYVQFLGERGLLVPGDRRLGSAPRPPLARPQIEPNDTIDPKDDRR